MTGEKWIIQTDDEEWMKRYEKAKAADMTPLGIEPTAQFGVFSGRHGIYNTYPDKCNCYDNVGSRRPCKHRLRLAMELGLLDGEYSSDINAVKYPKDATVVTKIMYVDSETGEAFNERSVPVGPLNGLTVVMTGEFEECSRSELAAIIGRAGGKIGSSVSRRTSCVVVGINPGSKLSKAKELSIPTYNLTEFLAFAGIDINK